MQKLKITKRERKAQGRNFAWWASRESYNVETYEVAGTEYPGRVPEFYVTREAGIPAVAHKVKPGVPFIRFG